MGACGGKRPKKVVADKFIKQENFLKYYEINEFVRSGAFGIVRTGHLISSPDTIVAIKSINKTLITPPSRLRILKNQFSILYQLDHPYVIKIIESYEDNRYLHNITEYCSGGNILDRISAQSSHSEKEASNYFRQILTAVNYLHNEGICHGDIRPENFRFTSPDLLAGIKLINIGANAKYGDIVSTESSIHFTPPEILMRKTPTAKGDVWGLGVILYLMITGELPFKGENLTEKIKRGELAFGENISEAAKDLISRMIVLDPKSRISLGVAINHQFFKTENIQRTLSINPLVFRSLKEFENSSQLKKETMERIVKYVNYEQLRGLKEIFEKFDTDKSGYLNLEELQNAFNASGVNIENLGEVVNSLDFNTDGRINYSEFLAATFLSKVRLNEDMIWTIFRQFDSDNSGFITVDELKREYYNRGKHPAYQEIMSMINEVDLGEKDGKISYEEFKNMFKWS